MNTYEKKYKGALARCKWLLSNGMISKIAATDMFRELIDDDSENVGKKIIHIFHSLAKGKIPVDINYADIFTWLEKQDKSDKIVEKAKTEKQRVLITESDGSANIDWDTRSLEDVKKLLECGLQYINTELEKQGERKCAWGKDDEYRVEILYAFCEEEMNKSSVDSTVYRELQETRNWLNSLKERMGG